MAKKQRTKAAPASAKDGSGESGDAKPAPGRPTIFTPELGTEICEGLASGKSLREVCAADGLPDPRTVYRWLLDDKHAEFCQQYARARELQAEKWADEIVDVADDGSNDWMQRHSKDGQAIGWVENGEAVSRSRLRVDTRKWVLSKLMPKKYGDKVAVTGGDGEGPVVLKVVTGIERG